MLVLSRRLHESVVIGDDIRVTPLRIGSLTARLRFDMPAGCSIIMNDREEISEGNSICRTLEPGEHVQVGSNGAVYLIQIRAQKLDWALTFHKKYPYTAKKSMTQ